jgi:hypothetical protein
VTLRSGNERDDERVRREVVTRLNSSGYLCVARARDKLEIGGLENLDLSVCRRAVLYQTPKPSLMIYMMTYVETLMEK